MKGTMQKIKRFVTLFFELHITGSAAELSYYFLFSVFPLLLAMSAVTAIVSGSEGILPNLLENLLPLSVSALLTDFYNRALNANNSTFLYSGILLALYAVARYITILKRKIREIFHSEKDYGFVKEWALSLLIALLIVLGFYLTFALQLLGDRTLRFLSERIAWVSESVIDIFLFLRFFAIGLYMFVLLSAAYRFVPNPSLKMRDVLAGTTFSGFAWIAVSVGFSFYVDHISHYTVLYGSIAGFIVLMLWLFLVNNIILLGALITRVRQIDSSDRPRRRVKTR